MKDYLLDFKSLLFMVLFISVPCIVMADDVPLTGLAIKGLPKILVIGKSYQFSLVKTPADATEDDFSASIDPDGIVECSSDYFHQEGATITAVAGGTCTITIEGGSVQATKTVTVRTDLPLQPSESTFIDIDLTDKDIDVSTLDWSDSQSLTTFLKSIVPGIGEGFTFQKYRSNTDVKGFVHYDCKQVDSASGYDIFGCELIAHVSGGKLRYVTGCLASQVSTTQVTDLPLLYSEPSGQFDPKVSEYTESQTLTGNLYYYKGDGITAEKTFGGATDGSTYVLQDPGRVYTIDFTNQINMENYSIATTEPSLTDLLNAGKNFSSTTSNFSDGYVGMQSKVSSMHFQNLLALTDDDSGTLNLEIRKFKLSDVSGQDYDAVWSKGTPVATSSAEIQEDYAVGNFIDFTFSTPAVFSMPNRQMDPDATIEGEAYLFRISSSSNALYTNVLPLENGVGVHDFYVNDENMELQVNRELVNCQPALDIHWGLERTLDAYKESFGINGYDNHGSPVAALVNFDSPNNSAYTGYQTTDGCAIMNFGLGCIDFIKQESANYNFYPLTSLDVMAHEFTHAVARKITSPDVEPQALNESYADIMGQMVERKTLSSDYSFTTLGEKVNYVSWRIGMLCATGSPIVDIRRFNDPLSDTKKQPNYYKGARWNEINPEHHACAGVQNYWFYLLCTGAENFKTESPEAVNITAIPRDSAELIAFGSLMYFATPCVDYPTARKNSIRAAEMYFGKNSQEVKSVYSAWYAVGVGTDEWKPGDPTSLNAVESTENLYDNNDRGTCKTTISNGRVLIIKNGKKYSLSGQVIE